MPYATAAAFRTALKAKFTEIAKHDPRFSVAELQRQFAYDRILSRCFSAADADRWMLKGAGALLAAKPQCCGCLGTQEFQPVNDQVRLADLLSRVIDRLT